jgi:UDP-N-acetylmuramoyl-tripeptide--D-alanyl-D-alanine ligase
MATPIPKNDASFDVWEVAAITHGQATRVAGAGARGTFVTTDSRAVVSGSIFVALRGERVDGHEFVKTAEASGAVIAVVERGQSSRATSCDVVEVDDTLLALRMLGQAHLRAWRRAKPAGPRVVAITGSAGKTTTKELTRALLQARRECHATLGNLNNLIGAPSVAFGLHSGFDAVVFELGMSVPGEIAALAQMTEPDVGIITNVGLAHAGGVGGTRSDVGREKGALFASLPEDAVAIVCADDAAACGQLPRTRARQVLRFGRAVSAHYRLVDRGLSADGTPFLSFERGAVDVVPGPITIAFPLAGEAAAIDFLAALAAAEHVTGSAYAGPEIERALAGLALSGRMALARLRGNVLLIDDSYNANPGSFRAALGTAQELGQTRRKVAVLGEMKELGAVATEEHDRLGDHLAQSGFALAIGCGGELVRRALRRAESLGLSVLEAHDADGAAELLLSHVTDGDVVLVKGSRSANTDRVAAALVRHRAPEARN